MTTCNSETTNDGVISSCVNFVIEQDAWTYLSEARLGTYDICIRLAYKMDFDTTSTEGEGSVSSLDTRIHATQEVTVAETTGLQFGLVSIDVGAPNVALTSSLATSRVGAIGAQALVYGKSDTGNSGEIFQMGPVKDKRRYN